MKHTKTERVGEVRLNSQGEKMTIIEYRRSKDIDVEFDDGTIINGQYDNFKCGGIKNPNHNKTSRVGKKGVNYQGCNMEIIEYIDCDNILVVFEDGTRVENRAYRDFLNGSIKNINFKSVCGVGYIGGYKYDSRYRLHNDTSTIYKTWCNMLRRCYNEERLKLFPTYRECSVCEEWHNFQNFAKWYEDNYIRFGDKVMCLDKDILVKGNKVYSPNTCILVDSFINSIFVKNNNDRGEYPIGVCYRKDLKKFNGYYHTNKKRTHLGYFDTPEEAFYEYKRAKEKYIKQVADEYKAKYPNFPQRLHDAMYSYEVDISD